MEALDSPAAVTVFHLTFEAEEQAARQDTLDHPTRATAWRRLGDALRARWRLPDAAAALARATALDATDADAWASRGAVEIARGQIDDGLASCRRASRLRSHLDAPHRHRANGLLARLQTADAARAAAEARRLAPERAENLITLATAWFQGGLHDGARRLIDRVVAAHPANAEALVTRALMRAHTDDAGADADLARALTLKPWLAPGHATLAHLRQRQGRLDDALAAITQARALHPEAEEYLLLHLDLLRRQDPGAALALATTAVTQFPGSRPARLWLAMLLLDTGAIDRARRLIPAILPTATAPVCWDAIAATWQVLGRPLERGDCLTRAVDAGGTPAMALGLADARYRLGDAAGALTLLDSLPPSPARRGLEAEILARLNRVDDAIAVMRQSLDETPDDALTEMRLGIAYRSRKDYERAEAALRHTVALVPHEPVAHEQLAILFSEMGRYDEAVATLQRAQELAPDNVPVRFNLAVVLARQKRWTDAERLLRDVVAAAPLHVSAIGILGRVIAEQQRYEEASELFEQAIELVPLDAGARDGLLTTLRQLRRHDEATRAARAWIDDCPNEAQAWRALALALATQGEVTADEAAAHVERLEPGSVLAAETKALVSLSLNRAGDALAWFDRALALAPDQPGLIVNRALALDEVTGLDDAARELVRALAIDPSSEGARLNLSMVNLRLGRFADGWPLYEARGSALKGPKTLLEAKRAAGGRPDLRECCVLVRAEQGLGDTIQFMRYVPQLASECREVIFHLQDQIAWMAWGLAPNVRVSGYRDPVPSAFDYHTSLISLPGYYDTDLDSIPGGVPYVAADPALVARWRGHLGVEGYRIGLVWHTNPAHGNIKRWIPLAALAPLARIPGVRTVSLQKFHGLDQWSALPSALRPEALPDGFDEGPDAFADAAALLMSLDLVITIDTSMAHLAGALGRPAWVLLPRSSDWRWLNDRDTSPWYPSVRLFQQQTSGDWSTVAAQVYEAVAQLAAERAR